VLTLRRRIAENLKFGMIVCPYVDDLEGTLRMNVLYTRQLAARVVPIEWPQIRLEAVQS
jgi:hypothetical protein